MRSEYGLQCGTDRIVWDSQVQNAVVGHSAKDAFYAIKSVSEKLGTKMQLTLWHRRTNGRVRKVAAFETGPEFDAGGDAAASGHE